MPDVYISNTVTNETTIHIEVHLEPSYVYIITIRPPKGWLRLPTTISPRVFYKQNDSYLEFLG